MHVHIKMNVCKRVDKWKTRLDSMLWSGLIVCKWFASLHTWDGRKLVHWLVNVKCTSSRTLGNWYCSCCVGRGRTLLFLCRILWPCKCTRMVSSFLYNTSRNSVDPSIAISSASQLHSIRLRPGRHPTQIIIKVYYDKGKSTQSVLGYCTFTYCME